MPTEDLSNRAPTLAIHWDAVQVGITGTELVRKLDEGTPRIFVTGGQGRRPEMMKSSIGIMPYMMQPGDAKIVAETLSKYLRNPGKFDDPVKSTAPDAAMTGTWNVTIQYKVGTGHQKLLLAQEGTAVTGKQAGEIFNADLKGHVQGDHVELRSSMYTNGQDVPFTFTGTVSGSNYSGDVNLGEYGTATFTAVKG